MRYGEMVGIVEEMGVEETRYEGLRGECNFKFGGRRMRLSSEMREVEVETHVCS